MLNSPMQRQLHLDLGFGVDNILKAVEKGKGRQKTTPSYDGARKQALSIPPDIDWLVEESKHYNGWNGENKRKRYMPTSKAALISHSMGRLCIGQVPPSFAVPAMPINLPSVKHYRTKLQWPYKPGVLLSFSVYKVTRQSFADIDLIASPSFFHALIGSSAASSKLKASYLVQRIKNTVVVQSLAMKSHRSNDIGMLVEQVTCPSHSCNSSNHCLSKFNIDGRNILCSAEIDGYDIKTATSVEVKAKKGGLKLKDFTQIMFNGGSKIVNFQVSNDKTRLESCQTFSRDRLRKRFKKPWIYAGQRVKYLLPLVLDHPAVRGATSSPVIMTFDNAKLPKFADAPPGYSLIPPDYDQE